VRYDSTFSELRHWFKVNGHAPSILVTEKELTISTKQEARWVQIWSGRFDKIKSVERSLQKERYISKDVGARGRSKCREQKDICLVGLRRTVNKLKISDIGVNRIEISVEGTCK
jgi:hypothetical protein